VKNTAPTQAPVELLICTKCRVMDAPCEEDVRPGAHLHAALAGAEVPGVTVRAVECLSNCSRGCSVALRGPGRWSYVYGNLAPEQAATLVEGALKYAATPDGLVPWRERPEHFRKNCIARIPPLDAFDQTEETA